MRRFLIFVLALLTSTALSASLAACRQVPQGGSPSLRVTPSSSPTPTATNTPKPTTTPTPTATATLTEVPLPLYWQCGPNIRSISEMGGQVEEEVRDLPTGLSIEREFTDFTYLKAVTALACLTKLNDVPDPFFPGVAFRGKVVFFDLDGQAHEYSIMMGALDNSGDEKVGSIGIPTLDGRGVEFRNRPIKENLAILEEFYNSSDVTVSRQIEIDFATKDSGAPWILGKYINQNRELMLQLIEALKTGRGFPENVSEDFFLWITQLSFMSDFRPSAYP